MACTHQPRPARHQLGVGAQSCSGPYVDVAEPAPTLVGHVLLFGVAERSDLVAPNVYCRAGGRVCREKKEKPCRDWCDTPCAATRSENRTLAHQNPTQEAGQAEFKPNALLPGRTRTSNPSVNSRTLCQLSYRGPPGPCERWRSRGTTLAYWCDGAQLGRFLTDGSRLMAAGTMPVGGRQHVFEKLASILGLVAAPLMLLD